MKSLTTVFLLIFISLGLHAQWEHPCGTQDGKSQWLEQYQQGFIPKNVTGGILNVPVQIHIVGNNEGSGYFPVMDVLKAFCTLQDDFADSGIHPYMHDEFKYIDNTTYYDHNFNGGYAMMENNNVADVINCYIVEDPAGNCGYSVYSLGIALRKSCLGPNDHTWSHEIGHYLSLPHTFSGWEGEEAAYGSPAPNYIGGELVEKADGSNCASAADGFCDTPADYISDRWQCNSEGLSSTLTDPTGETFKAEGKYIMSYSNDECASIFSEEQEEAMRTNVTTVRSYLLDQDSPMSPISGMAAPISPMNGESVALNGNTATLEWEPIQNANKYIIQVNIFPIFNTVLYEFTSDEPAVDATGLNPNITYYWRVTGYNNWSTCTEFSSVSSFLATQTTSTQTPEWANSFNVYPNPVNNGEEITISASVDTPQDSELRIFDVMGKQITASNWSIKKGYNRTTINTNNLSAGVYVLECTTTSGTISRKIIVE